jgi:alpha-mannosidase
MDQGVHDLRFLVSVGRPERLRRLLSGTADWLDAPPFALAHLPIGSFRRESRSMNFEGDLLSLKGEGVRMTACKRTRDGEGILLRIHETAGKPVRVRLGFKPGQHWADVLLKSFEIKTLRFQKAAGWQEVDPFSEA